MCITPAATPQKNIRVVRLNKLPPSLSTHAITKSLCKVHRGRLAAAGVTRILMVIPGQRMFPTQSRARARDLVSHVMDIILHVMIM